MLYDTLKKELVRRGDSKDALYLERSTDMLFEENKETPVEAVENVKEVATIVEEIESATKAAKGEPNIDILPKEPVKPVKKEKKPAGEKKYFVTCAFLANIRKDPDPNSEVIGNFANGDEIKVDVNFNDEKYYRTVNSKGYPGYILKSLVEIR